jgi:hypothetical protein
MPSFRSFAKLKHLSLTDVILVGASPGGLPYFHNCPRVTAQHLIDMLLPQLEQFTHILWKKPSAYDSFISQSERLNLWKKVWNEGDAASYFPSLKKVQISEYNVFSSPPGKPYTIWPLS